MKESRGTSSGKFGRTKGLVAGEWVEVRSEQEILATLDERGRYENLPFMPEMLKYCGQRYRTYRRADKTCDPGREPWSIRRVKNCVHLEGLRCDGGSHGGCQAGCLLFWNEVWLKRVENPAILSVGECGTRPLCSDSWLMAPPDNSLVRLQAKDVDGKTVYSCQATELRDFTIPMRAWDPGQYIRDLRSGNLSTGLAKNSRWGRAIEIVLASVRLIHALIASLAAHYTSFPFIAGNSTKTQIEHLGLEPGELVEVRSKEEIVSTLDKHQRNRGLLFDGEMIPYCGGIYRVLRRVDHIIDEQTGRMITMKYPCIILDGVVCRSEFHRLCPRSIYPYWRENWLRRASRYDIPCLGKGKTEADMAR